MCCARVVYFRLIDDTINSAVDAGPRVEGGEKDSGRVIKRKEREEKKKGNYFIQ